MADGDIDVLRVARGLVVAPAGCGKTQLIADALIRHDDPKPILVLTHTNAGVAALRSRLDRAGVKPSAYRLSTIDGWAIRLITTFPQRSGHDPSILTGQRPNYRAIREAAFGLLKSKHVNDVVAASYSRMLVDEYQDCSICQHGIVYYASLILPVCVMGDRMQAIFGFGDDPLADWDKHVCGHFALAGTLDRPWRWINAGAEQLGAWLLDARRKLLAGAAIDLRTLPDHVVWVSLDGSPSDDARHRKACQATVPGGHGGVLIIDDSLKPDSHRRFARLTPGAATVEAVDLRDLVSFAANFDLKAPDALGKIASFAEGLMTNTSAAELVRRTATIMRGADRRAASDVELAAIAFLEGRTYQQVVDLLVEMNMAPGTHVYRLTVLRACLRALEICQGPDAKTFGETAIHIREQNRVLGRSLPHRAVGSTLLLKGLEADVVVILKADDLDARNLYVAMTRGSKRVVVCSKSPVLNPKAP